MKILFIAGGSAPTIFALAPLATAARNAGHEVIMTSTEHVLPTVVSAGLPAIPFTSLDISHFISTDRAGNRLEIPEDPTEQLLFTGRWFGRMAAAGLDELTAVARRWPPDLIVGGTMSYAAPLLAARLNVPYVRHTWDISDPMLMDQGANEELRPELDQYGLQRIPDPDLLIDICPPSIQRADAPAAQLMRWVPANRQRVLEPWMYARGERRRVCVTSGHRVAHDQNFAFLRELAKTIGDLDLEMIVAAPEDIAAELRAELPDIRADWFPLDVVVPTCDLVVSHAGGVTVMTALNAGVPQLLLPARDAKAVAPSQRLMDHGAAISLLRDEEDTDTIAAACATLVENPTHAARAHDLATEIAALPPVADIIPLLEHL